MLALAPQAPALAAGAGSLDRSFSRDGRVVSDLFGGSDKARAVAMQGRRIVVAGHVNGGLPALVRYRHDGRLDRSFAHRGHKILRSWDGGEASAIAIQANGRIVIAGDDGESNLAVARLRRDGSLDRSFSHDGRLRTAILPGADYSADVAIQDDTKIIVVGHSHGVTSGRDWLIMARYGPGGHLDRSFSDNGKLRTRFGTGSHVLGYGVALQRNGKIVVSGEVSNSWIVARFRPDGRLDRSFDDDGVSFSAPTLIGRAYDVAIQPNGKIVTAGTDFGAANLRFAVGRYLRDGRLDPSFGTGGAVHTRFSRSGRGDWGYALALQDDGRIVVAGWANKPSPEHPSAVNPRFALARYERDGRLDRSFAGDGKRVTDMRPARRQNQDEGQDVAIQANGRIVVAGFSRIYGEDDDFAVARYLGG